MTLSIQAQVLEPKLRAFPIDLLEQGTRGAGQQPSVIAFHSPQNRENPDDVLVARGEDTALVLKTYALGEMGVTIPSSHWVRDYAPTFEIGRFMTVDIPRVDELPPTDGELATRVAQAAEGLRRMEEDVRKGEWTQCAEDSRPVLELLNRPELLRPLLRTTGLPESNETALLEGLKQVFTYTHAFHHRVERDGTVTEGAVNADPEDAILAFATTAALLNLVARKLQRRVPKASS